MRKELEAEIKQLKAQVLAIQMQSLKVMQQSVQSLLATQTAETQKAVLQGGGLQQQIETETNAMEAEIRQNQTSATEAQMTADETMMAEATQQPTAEQNAQTVAEQTLPVMQPPGAAATTPIPTGATPSTTNVPGATPAPTVQATVTPKPTNTGSNELQSQYWAAMKAVRIAQHAVNMAILAADQGTQNAETAADEAGGAVAPSETQS